MGVSIGIRKPERAHERREEGRTLKCSGGEKIAKQKQYKIRRYFRLKA